ncbi:hypothetical protein L9F63_000101, partial [Diploptera punctata]
IHGNRHYWHRKRFVNLKLLTNHLFQSGTNTLSKNTGELRIRLTGIFDFPSFAYAIYIRISHAPNSHKCTHKLLVHILAHIDEFI